ncbi:hypothetical protein RUND412_006144 [Rhizina undulata]
MTTNISTDQHYPPRNYHYTRSTITTYYPSSTSTHPTSYYSNGPPSTISSCSSKTATSRVNAGLAAARHVTKVAGRLKRGRSGHKDEESDDFDEGFFSGPGSPLPAELFTNHSSTAHRAKTKIKPLLKKVSGSRGNSLDLSRSDGGLPNGVGLGIYDNAGYESSGIDEETAFPYRHRRNFSGTSGNSPLLVGPGGNQTFAHPKRQVPRRKTYQPEIFHYPSPIESSEGSSEDEHELDMGKVVLRGARVRPAARGLKLDTGEGGRSTPMLTSESVTNVHQSKVATTQIPPISPISPIDFPPKSSATTSTPRLSKFRSRTSLDKNARETSPSFADSVIAARLAWEAKEEKKEEKRERKRRRSEAKEGERSRAASRCSGRIRGNSGGSKDTQATIWDEDEQTINEKVSEEDEDDIGGYYKEAKFETDSRGMHGTGPKWGVLGDNDRRKRPGFKKRWMGFVVWVRIGMVRLGRKMGF